MTRFRCIGTECRDNCCHHWRIRVDREHHDKLQARMSSPEEQAEFAAAVQRQEGDDPQLHALLVLGDDGCCRFLGRDRSCTVQARFGEDFLPDACSRYPRTIGRLGEDYELYGSPSCPEIVTQMLAGDDAMDLVPVGPESFGRGLVSHVLDPEAASLYQQSLPGVRDTALWLLGQRRFPVASRLFFIACLANRARRFLHREMPPGHVEELRQICRALQTAGALDHLDQQYRGLVAGTRFAISVVRELLCLPDRFHPAALIELRGEAGVLLASRGARLGRDEDVDLLDRVYLGLPPLPAEAEERLAIAVERYATNKLLLEWYTKTPSFLGWVFGLLSRVAVIRFLVRTVGTVTAPEGFDELLVRVIYAFSRLLEHNAPLAARLLENLEEQGVFGIEYAASLTRV